MARSKPLKPKRKYLKTLIAKMTAKKTTTPAPKISFSRLAVINTFYTNFDRIRHFRPRRISLGLKTFDIRHSARPT